MQYNVYIEPCGLNLSVKATETILDAALRQGYQFPHECMSGTCGTCRGRLLEGQVRYEDDYLPGLTNNERETGYALFCSAKPASDLIIYIEGVVEPAKLPIKKVVYSVNSIEPLTKTAIKIILQSPENDHLSYHAGQYIEILQRDKSPKPFSIANAPLGNSKFIELHIRQTTNNSYAAELLVALKTGAHLTIQGPYGHCVLKQDPPFPFIFIAGGVGFSPIKALIEQALATGFDLPIYLYWGARTLTDLYMHDAALRWAKHVPNFHYIPVLSSPDKADKWQGKIGLVHEAVIADHNDLSRYHIYASGPTEMVYAALHAFQAQGLDRSLMYSDSFSHQF